MEIKKNVHPLWETLGLAYLGRHLDAVEAETIAALDAAGVKGAQFYKKYLGYLRPYVMDFQAAYQPGPDDSFLLGQAPDPEFFRTVVALAMELPELETALPQLGDGELRRRIAPFFALEDEAAPDLDSPQARFAFLQSLELAEGTKWKLFTLLEQPGEKLGAVFALYRRNRPAFEAVTEKHRVQLAPLLAQGVTPSPVLAGLLETVAEEHVALYPTAVFPFSEWVISATAFQGVLVEQLARSCQAAADSQAALPPLLKILGDRSKFQILCALRQGGKYNLELAEELGLTPATVSHHMGILLSNQLVTVEKREAKLRYRLDREAVGEVVKGLVGVFGLEDMV